MCFEQRYLFSPYVVCTSELLGKKEKALNKHLVQLLARKWDTHYSVMCRYVNTHMSVTIMGVSHLYI